MGKGLQQTLRPLGRRTAVNQDFLADHNCDHSADSSYELQEWGCWYGVQSQSSDEEGFADGQSSDSASRDSASGCNSCMDPRMILPMTTACVYVGFWVRFASGCMTWKYKQMGPEEVCEVRQQTGGVSAAVPSISPGQVKSSQVEADHNPSTSRSTNSIQPEFMDRSSDGSCVNLNNSDLSYIWGENEGQGPR